MDPVGVIRRLEVAPRGDREVVMTRVLNAPRRQVYDAWTQPEKVARWYGPSEWTMTVCQIDLRVGGGWHYALRGPDGSVISMKGLYREVVAGERLVSTESVEGLPGESLNTLTLGDRDGLTTLTAVVLYDAQETRDAVLASHLEIGAGASFDRLERALSFGHP